MVKCQEKGDFNVSRGYSVSNLFISMKTLIVAPLIQVGFILAKNTLMLLNVVSFFVLNG